MAVRWLRGHQKWTVTGQKAAMKSPPKNNQTPTKTRPTKTKQTKNTNTKQNRGTKWWQVPVRGLIHARDDSIVSSRHGMAAKTQGRTQKKPGHTRRRVKQQKHHAETKDPPSQDPRDHMAQADRHNNSPIVTSKQRQRRVATRVVKRKVKRTVKHELMWEEQMWNGQWNSPAGALRVRSVVLFRSSYSWAISCAQL